MNESAFRCEDGFILGGGLTGLYAGLCLVRQGRSVTLFEREDRPGGFYRAFRRDGQLVSLGHAIPTADLPPDIAGDLRTLLGEQLVEFEPRPVLHWNGRWLPIPVPFASLARALPLGERMRAWNGVFRSQFARRTSRNAIELLRKRYGKPVSTRMLEPFLTRYWGGELDSFHPDLVRSEPDLLDFTSLRTALARVGFGIGRPDGEPAPPPTTALASREGAGAIPRLLEEAFKSAGGRIIYGAEVTEIALRGKRVDGVFVRDRMATEDAMVHRLPCEFLLSTIPMRSLVKAIHKGAPAQIHASSLYLDHRPVSAFVCRIDREWCLETAVAHFRDRSFHRVTEPKHGQHRVEPSSETLLLLETVDRVTRDSEEAAWEQVVADLEATGIARADEIRERFLLQSPSGPPIHRLEYPEHHRRVLDFLRGLENLHCAGGTGTFRRLTPGQALAEGRAAAERFLERRPAKS